MLREGEEGRPQKSENLQTRSSVAVRSLTLRYCTDQRLEVESCSEFAYDYEEIKMYFYNSCCEEL